MNSALAACDDGGGCSLIEGRRLHTARQAAAEPAEDAQDRPTHNGCESLLGCRVDTSGGGKEDGAPLHPVRGNVPQNPHTFVRPSKLV